MPRRLPTSERIKPFAFALPIILFIEPFKSPFKIAKVANIADTILKLQKENVWVYGSCGEAEKIYTDMDFKGNIAIFATLAILI